MFFLRSSHFFNFLSLPFFFFCYCQDLYILLLILSRSATLITSSFYLMMVTNSSLLDKIPFSLVCSNLTSLFFSSITNFLFSSSFVSINSRPNIRYQSVHTITPPFPVLISFFELLEFTSRLYHYITLPFTNIERNIISSSSVLSLIIFLTSCCSSFNLALSPPFKLFLIKHL